MLAGVAVEVVSVGQLWPGATPHTGQASCWSMKALALEHPGLRTSSSLPNSTRSAEVGVAAVDRRLDEAARMLGAGRLRRLARVDVPLMAPALAAGGGLVLLSTMKELPATLLASPVGFETLATRIWNANSDGFLANVGLASLVLIAVSAALTWLLVIRNSEHLR